jgi:hypothetical protein
MTAEIESNAVPDAFRRAIWLIQKAKVEMREAAADSVAGCRSIRRHRFTGLHKI